MQVCTKCQISQPLDNFAWRKPNIRRTTCRGCQAEYRKQHYLNNLEKYKEKARRWARLNPDKTLANDLKHYGLTTEEFLQMSVKQKNNCWICQEPPVRGRLRVDHCHRTGKVRGLLCSLCNLALGNIKENVKSAKRLVKYIQDTHVA